MCLFSDVVNTLNNGATSPAYWIGANLLLAPKWTWTTNQTALYTNWAPDEPADPSNFDCGSVRTDSTNLWKKELCYSARPFVCTADPSNAPATPPPSDSPCEPGYTLYENQCFKLFNGFIKQMNYYDSSIFCQEHHNATLVKITSVGIQNIVESLIFDEKSDIWIGLACWSRNSCWWWDFSNPTYTNFANGEPAGQHPVTMFHTNGLWYVEVDWLPFAAAVVCQKPARAVTINNV